MLNGIRENSCRQVLKMAIRSQMYYYNLNGVFTPNVAVRTMATTLTQAAITKATEFVVIEKIAATPWAVDDDNVLNTMMQQIEIATTGYFVRPDGIQSVGVPSQATPYPRSGNFKRAVFEMTPPVYVLPGQNWEYILTPDATAAGTFDVRAMLKYTLYDNADSQFAVELFRMGVSVTPQNVDEYKRLMLEQQVAEGTYKPVGA